MSLDQDVQEMDARRKLINEIVSDCSNSYCTARMILTQANKKTSPCPCSNCGNCTGKDWCENRQKLYESPMSERTLTQMKLMEVRRYLDCIHDRSEEDWKVTSEKWVDLVRGDTFIFRYAWDELGIRDMEALKRVCVYSVVDTEPILDPQKPEVYEPISHLTYARAV